MYLYLLGVCYGKGYVRLGQVSAANFHLPMLQVKVSRTGTLVCL